MHYPCIHIIAAIGKDTKAIGYRGNLLWQITEDLKRFKDLTTGHPVIMGRKTFESIGKPLPDRLNIVISRNPEYAAGGITVAHSLDEAISLGAKTDKRLFVIGGGEIYRDALPLTHVLHLTLVESNTPGDTFFPDYSEFCDELRREEKVDPKTGLRYVWVDLAKPETRS